MKKFLYLLSAIIIASILSQCAGTKIHQASEEPPFDPIKRPGWVDKLPYVSNVNIMETIGVADPQPSFAQKRQAAIENAYTNMVLQLGGPIKTFSDNYTKNYRNFYKDQNYGGSISETQTTIAIENVVKRNQIAAWWDDPKTGVYWVYMFMPMAAVEAEVMKEEEERAIRDGLILEIQRDNFNKRMNEELEKRKKEEEEQRKQWEIEYDKKSKGE